MIADITTTPTTMLIDMSNIKNTYSKYKLEIKQWQLDGSQAVLLSGFPKEITANTFFLDKLTPGRYFQVTHPHEAWPD